ncbi:MAG: diguanylate cyclase [Gammaproteobacteria bacterium]|nr:diguanylate cyclase [Gammaproteobacteria bacterium]
MKNKNNKIHTSRKTMLIGFIIVMMLLIILSMISIKAIEKSVSNLRDVIEINGNHLYQLNKMHTAARERILTVFKIVSVDDPFIRDELWMQFNSFGTEFIVSRNDLYNMPISDEIKQLLEEQDQLTQPLGRIQHQIVQLAIDDENNVAKHLLFTKANPLQTQMLQFFRKIESNVENKNNQALIGANHLNWYAKRIVLLASILITLISIYIAYLIYKTVNQSENNLKEAQKRAMITLHSIADGVFLTNAQGRIEQVNGVAQSLLGLKSEKIVGCYLDDVVHLYSEHNLSQRIELLRSNPHINQVKKSNGWIFLQRNEDELLAVEYSISPVIINQELNGIVVVFHDINEIQKLHKQLNYQVNHDELTQLYNRRIFEKQLIDTINEVKRYDEIKAWLCYIDLDNFKTINDTAGHLAGDQLLKQVAQILLGAVRNTDYVARLGGDEFAIILRHANEQEAKDTAERIRFSLEAMIFEWQSQEFNVTASLGLTNIDDDSDNIDVPLKKADEACYTAKKTGRNKLCYLGNVL